MGIYYVYYLESGGISLGNRNRAQTILIFKSKRTIIKYVSFLINKNAFFFCFANCGGIYSRRIVNMAEELQNR